MPISFEDFPAIAMFDDTLAASSTCFAVRARGRPHAPRAFPAGLEVSSSTAYKRPWEMMWLRRVLMSCLDTTWYNVIQADTDPEGSATFLDSAPRVEIPKIFPEVTWPFHNDVGFLGHCHGCGPAMTAMIRYDLSWPALSLGCASSSVWS